MAPRTNRLANVAGLISVLVVVVVRVVVPDVP